ncbi:MAG: hypothetical protein EKK57_02690 [Proteobacteria bacterium]|nr:MAG: hypothetical protein EKK57_02690 [Pseudomonadota bacterium]
MYTQIFYLSKGVEQTKFFLTALPYMSKFDSQKVISFDTLLTTAASFTDSLCIQQADTDTVIEWYSDIWAKSNLLRFFFLYDGGRYALYIVRINKYCNVKNGTVRNTVPNCKVLYRSAMTTLEMALNLDELDYYTEGILFTSEEDESDTNSYPPSSVLITTVSLYEASKLAMHRLSPSIEGLDKKAARVAIIKSGFMVKGTICAENAYPQKQMLPSIFYALQRDVKPISIEDLLASVKRDFPEHVKYCDTAIRKAKKYGNDLIAVNFRQGKD